MYVQRHVEDYSKSCTASVAWLNRPNFDWQAWENDSQALVAASVFWTCKTEKTSFPQHEMIKQKKKNTMELPRKRTKKRLKWAETSRLMHFVSKRLFKNVNAATRGFRSGGMFVTDAYVKPFALLMKPKESLTTEWTFFKPNTKQVKENLERCSNG